MNIPISWINEYTDIPVSTEQYTQRMIMTGTGVEGVEVTGSHFSKVVVGKIESVVKHENSDHLLICQINVGDKTLQIVTGAPNVFEGAYVPVALVGSVLPSGLKIKRGKLRGVESEGMLCSGSELEIPESLYSHSGDEGILIFNEPHEPGTDVKEVFGLGDEVIEFEILANRPDCLSVWGIARESAAALGTHFVKPEISVQESQQGNISDLVEIKVLDNELCPRYCAKVIRNVKIGQSPMWMRRYLYASGVRPINNIVDITNFVMLETGHPMHAFDLDKVRDGKIIVRRAAEGEELTTLDDKEHTLNNQMLVIADADKATGLAGIMGGGDSEITEATSTVLFECAAFDRASTRITARTLGIRTESSGRFERGVCPDTVMEALLRACQLVNELECGEVVPGVYDHYPNPQEERVVCANVERIRKRTSVDVPPETMVDLLDSLEIQTELDGENLKCHIPQHRLDLETEADISEEVLRLYGYDKIPSTMLSGGGQIGGRNERQKLRDKVRDTLVGMNAYEAMNFSFIGPRWLENLRIPTQDVRLNPIKVRNPLGEDTSVMRTTLVPSLLSNLALNNNRGNENVRMFEIAPVFIPRENDLPKEALTVCIGLYGDDADFYTIKDMVMCLLNRFGIVPRTMPGGDMYYHPGRKAVMILPQSAVQIAQLGEMHPDVVEKFEINRRVYLAEIDLEAVLFNAVPQPETKPLPKFPAVDRDLALVVSADTLVGPIIETIRTAGGRLLEEVKVFDVYQGLQLGSDKKSVAFSVRLRAQDRTLTENEISKAMENILKACEERHDAVLRS